MAKIPISTPEFVEKMKIPDPNPNFWIFFSPPVCFQGVYSSLYEVEISRKDQSKMDQLLEKLREKDLVSGGGRRGLGFWGLLGFCVFLGFWDLVFLEFWIFVFF